MALVEAGNAVVEPQGLDPEGGAMNAAEDSADGTEAREPHFERKLVSEAEAAVRAGFIRKVYGILSVQLLASTLIALPFMQMDPVWLAENSWITIVCSMVSIGAVCGVGCCCNKVLYTYPQNYMFLALVTVCEAVLVGFITAQYTVSSVLLAMGLTAVMFLALTAYAFTTKCDFTGAGPYLFMALVGLMLMGVVVALVGGDLGQRIYGCVGAILFSFYIVYDTQLMAGGSHSRHKFSVDDYVLAALNLYLDILNLFVFLLQLFGNRN